MTKESGEGAMGPLEGRMVLSAVEIRGAATLLERRAWALPGGKEGKAVMVALNNRLCATRSGEVRSVMTVALESPDRDSIFGVEVSGELEALGVEWACVARVGRRKGPMDASPGLDALSELISKIPGARGPAVDRSPKEAHRLEIAPGFASSLAALCEREALAEGLGRGGEGEGAPRKGPAL